MKAKTYKVLARAIEEGVEYGVRRYYKYADNRPSEAAIAEMIDEVSERTLGVVMEWFYMEETNDEQTSCNQRG